MTSSKKIDLAVRGIDSRGSIVAICEEKSAETSIIFSRAGSFRSNHYHKKDSHYMHVISGRMIYIFSTVGSTKYEIMDINPGESVYTPPNEFHVSYFPVDTTIVVNSMLPRDTQSYEEDTIRDNRIGPDNIHTILAGEVKVSDV